MYTVQYCIPCKLRYRVGTLRTYIYSSVNLYIYLLHFVVIKLFVPYRKNRKKENVHYMTCKFSWERENVYCTMRNVGERRGWDHMGEDVTAPIFWQELGGGGGIRRSLPADWKRNPAIHTQRNHHTYSIYPPGAGEG
jgi:hypothetical protein